MLDEEPSSDERGTPVTDRELELEVRVGVRILLAGGRPDMDGVLSAVSSLLLGIEICNDDLADGGAGPFR